MNERSARFAFGFLAISLAACGDKANGGAGSSASADGSAQPAASAQASASAQPTASAEAAAAAKCEPLGCTGEGSFFKMCDCKGGKQSSPFEIKATGTYSSMFKQPEFEVTNKSDKPVKWASAAVYYYDKAGKQLEGTINDKAYRASRVNGSNFSIKPGETKKLSLGFKKEAEPKGFDAMEIVIDGWCFGTHEDKESEVCVRIDRAPDDRPKGG